MIDIATSGMWHDQSSTPPGIAWLAVQAKHDVPVADGAGTELASYQSLKLLKGLCGNAKVQHDQSDIRSLLPDDVAFRLMRHARLLWRRCTLQHARTLSLIASQRRSVSSSSQGLRCSWHPRACSRV